VSGEATWASVLGVLPLQSLGSQPLQLLPCAGIHLSSSVFMFPRPLQHKSQLCLESLVGFIFALIFFFVHEYFFIVVTYSKPTLFIDLVSVI
jgi:hypothetical protein